MLDQREVTEMIDMLISNKVNIVVRRLEIARESSELRAIDEWRFLFWRMHAHLLASQFRLDLQQDELWVTGYIFTGVETCLLKGLGDTLPEPSLSWSLETREKELSKRAARMKSKRTTKAIKRERGWLRRRPNTFESWKAEILNVLAEERVLSDRTPITTEVLCQMRLRDMTRLVWNKLMFP